MTPLALALLVTLNWSAPTLGAWGCGPGVQPVYERQTHIVLRPRGQYPGYFVGIEDTPQWQNLIAWCRPDTDTVLTAMPGDSLHATSAPGYWHGVVVRNSRGGVPCVRWVWK